MIPTIVDFRPQLKQANWRIGTAATRKYFTVHYNGPTVAGFGDPKAEMEQIKFDARFHIAKDWGNGQHGDGIMYHGATLSNGTNLQLRNYDDVLWHCGVKVGNAQSISWHLPLGGDQHPTPQQESALYDVINHFVLKYQIDWHNVLGHREWKPTMCPGHVMPLVLRWRSNPQAREILNIVWYECFYDVNVRQGPSKRYPIASVLPNRSRFASDAKILGEDEDKKKWVHLASGLGFIREDLLNVFTPDY